MSVLLQPPMLWLELFVSVCAAVMVAGWPLSVWAARRRARRRLP